MKVVGIITEYNPFHHGHHYQLQAAKQTSQADVLIVLMSGNVVQRGEFAVLDKWQRAQLAVHYGADLVLELPLLASLQSADYFAKTGVELLARLGCDTVVFGTETATECELKAHVAWLEENEVALQAAIQTYLAQGFSYAAAMQMGIDELKTQETEGVPLETTFNPTSPNHMLGIQYVKANQALKQPMDILAIPRLLSAQQAEVFIQFDSEQAKIHSGSHIRQLWRQKALTTDSLPEETYKELNKGHSVGWEDYWLPLKYQLTCHRPETLRQVFGVKEGLEHLLLKNIDTALSFSDYRQSLISKRWTQSSIQRVLLAVLLDIQTEEWENYRSNIEKRPLLRILAYRPAGRILLKRLKKHSKIELFSNYVQKYQKRYDLMLRADRIVAINPRVKVAEQNYSRYPIQGEN
ncbi:tRNA(Met) cytidine acetate ligase [Fundicoccus sp. Sow4_D5]|uniref:tRNA(Met) cytidine acetate ligase n=1 Tax=unclassified Fundicoccus TaxID=2761543 RepID=UPI003F91751E